MLRDCEFKSTRYAIIFEKMLFFLQCSETVRASPQQTFACDVSLNNFGLLYEFFFNTELFLKKSRSVPAADQYILLFAFDFSYLLSVSFLKPLGKLVPLTKKKSRLL